MHVFVFFYFYLVGAVSDDRKAFRPFWYFITPPHPRSTVGGVKTRQEEAAGALALASTVDTALYARCS